MGRFDELVAGRKKYGKAKFQAMAKRGKAKSQDMACSAFDQLMAEVRGLELDLTAKIAGFAGGTLGKAVKIGKSKYGQLASKVGEKATAAKDAFGRASTAARTAYKTATANGAQAAKATMRTPVAGGPFKQSMMTATRGAKRAFNRAGGQANMGSVGGFGSLAGKAQQFAGPHVAPATFGQRFKARLGQVGSTIHRAGSAINRNVNNIGAATIGAGVAGGVLGHHTNNPLASHPQEQPANRYRIE